MDAKALSSCANPQCKSKFVRFGDGELFVYAISDPEAWGMPPDAKQKAFWLCQKCSAELTVWLDHRSHTAHVIRRSTFMKRAG